MVKKIYITAVALFLLTAVFVNDKPDFPKSTEAEIISDITTAKKLEWYNGTVQNRDYYIITNEKKYEFDKVTANTHCEVVCRIQKDENGMPDVVSIESKEVYGGSPDGFRWEQIIESEDINEFYGYVRYIGCFVKEQDVSYMPLLKVLPGMFLENTDFKIKNSFRTETVDIRVRLKPDEIIKMAQSDM